MNIQASETLKSQNEGNPCIQGKKKNIPCSSSIYRAFLSSASFSKLKNSNIETKNCFLQLFPDTSWCSQNIVGRNIFQGYSNSLCWFINWVEMSNPFLCNLCQKTLSQLAQSICTHYFSFEKLGRLADLKKTGSKIWGAKSRVQKTGSLLIKKRRGLAASSLFE